jgi:hypothetical protein
MVKKYDNYASYFGVNRSINPGIRVLVDFLSNYFNITMKLPKVNEFVNIERVKNLDNIICKETDEKTKERLYESFVQWVESYSFFHSYSNKNETKYLLPLSKKMLYRDGLTRDRLKNILYRLLYINKEDIQKFDEDKNKIENYLFNNTNSHNNLYSNISNLLDSFIEETDINNKSPEDNIGGVPFEDNELATHFREDFESLLTHSIFYKLDIYRRINSFTLLLNFYVTLYVINRAFDEKKVFILAKGSPDFSTETGRFHTATVGNFSNIREKIFIVSEKFYQKIIEYNNLSIGLKDETKVQILYRKEDIWPILKGQLFEAKKQDDDSIDAIIKDYLDISENYKTVQKKDLAKAFVEVSKKRSSSVRMLSSMFSGQGKEARMVYPITSAKYKYYAMSSEITELLLKLFLACEQKEYATLDMFLSWLEVRYGIYIAFSDKLMNYLSESGIKEPSNLEFSQNVQAFINTLNSISAIEKLSDNSYIVFDSGRPGGVSWLI